MTNQTTAQVADSGYPELPFDDAFRLRLAAEAGLVDAQRPATKLMLLNFAGKIERELTDRSSRLNGGGAVIEEIAQQWDGCMYESVGSDIDVGEAIRTAGARLAAQASPILPQEPIGITDDDGKAWCYGVQGGEFPPRTKLYAAAPQLPAPPQTLKITLWLDDDPEGSPGKEIQVSGTEMHLKILAEAMANLRRQIPTTPLPAPEGVSEAMLTDDQIRRVLTDSKLWDMHIHMGWYSDPVGAFKRHGITLARDLEKALSAALATPQPPAAQQAGKSIELNVIRYWPDGFADRLERVWRDLVGFIPNYKLYDLQRMLAEYGFTMTVYEGAAPPVSQQREHGGQVAAPDEADMATLRAALRARGYRDDGVPRVVTDRVLHMAREDQDLINMLQTLNSRYKARTALTQAEATPAPVVQPVIPHYLIGLLVAQRKDGTAAKDLEMWARDATSLLEQISAANSTPSPAALKPAEAVQAKTAWQPMATAHKGLIDIWAHDKRYMNCYRDPVCDEYRTLDHRNYLICIPLKDCKFWMEPPVNPATPPEQTGGGK